MRLSRKRHVIAVALGCYPARWRTRHDDDAKLLVAALLEDGVPWWSIALSLLAGAARERLLRKPSLRVGTTVAVLTLSAAAVPLALVASFTPAGASSVNVVIVISKPDSAAQQLETAFSAHHFKVTVTQRTVPDKLLGSILAVSASHDSRASARISELHGRCANGTSGCVDGLVIPSHFSGSARVTIGRAASDGVRGR